MNDPLPFSLMMLARWRPLFRPEDEQGAGDDTTPSGDDTAPSGDDTAPAADAGGTPWWQDDRFDEASQTQLKALGLTVDDPLDAVVKLAQMEANAKQKLGKGPDQLMDRPAKEQDMAEYLRANEIFGVPESADKYDLKRPDTVDEKDWDKSFEEKARSTAHQLALSDAQLQGLTDLYAQHTKEKSDVLEQSAQQAIATMRQELEADFGAQTDAKMALAQQAAQLVAEKAGLDLDALAHLSSTVADKTGDAAVIKMFAAIGDALADDSLPDLRGDSPGLGTTPAGARAELEAMKAPDSDYAKAIADKRAGKPGAKARFDVLEKKRVELAKLANPPK